MFFVVILACWLLLRKEGGSRIRVSVHDVRYKNNHNDNSLIYFEARSINLSYSAESNLLHNSSTQQTY